LYKIYDREFAELIKPIALEISAETGHRIEENADLAKSSVNKLFQLFIQLKLFCDKGIEIGSTGESRLREFSSWFCDTTEHWNEFSVFTTIKR
jgi:hypothetical protein